MSKKLNLLAILLLSGTLAFAQRTFSSAPTDPASTKTQPAIIVTDSNAKEYFGSDAGAEKPKQNLHTSIKLNPLLIISGDMPVYVEHKIANKFSAEVSVGMTYSNTLVDATEMEYYPEYMRKQNEMGYSYSAALRYYPSNSYETMEGYYFAPEYRNRVYKSTATEYMNQSIHVKQTKNVSEYRLLFGYTDFFEDHIFIDFYTGIGMRTKEYRNLVKEGTNVWTGQPFDNQYSLSNETKTAPVLALGFKVGFSF